MTSVLTGTHVPCIINTIIVIIIISIDSASNTDIDLFIQAGKKSTRTSII